MYKEPRDWVPANYSRTILILPSRNRKEWFLRTPRNTGEISKISDESEPRHYQSPVCRCRQFTGIYQILDRRSGFTCVPGIVVRSPRGLSRAHIWFHGETQRHHSTEKICCSQRQGYHRVFGFGIREYRFTIHARQIYRRSYDDHPCAGGPV